MRDSVRYLITHPLFERVVVSAIAINAIILGIETFPSVMQSHGDLLHQIDLLFVVFFVAELSLRIYVQRGSFFHYREGWNWFDFLIVALTLMPFIGNVSALRAFRILRALRLLSAVPALRKVITGILRAINGFAAVLAVLLVVNYVAAVLASKMFGEHFPDRFGNLLKSLFSLFQIMTLDDWTGIAGPIIDKFPSSTVFFIGFICVTVFLLLSIIVGISANAMHDNSEVTERQNLENKLDEVLKLLRKNASSSS